MASRVVKQKQSRRQQRAIKRDQVLALFVHKKLRSVAEISNRTGLTMQAVTHALRVIERSGAVYRVIQGVYCATHPVTGD